MLTACQISRGAAHLQSGRAASTEQQRPVAHPYLTSRASTAAGYNRAGVASSWTARMRLAAATQEHTEAVQETGTSSEALGSMEANSCAGAGSVMERNAAEHKSAVTSCSAGQVRPRKTALSALDDVGNLPVLLGAAIIFAVIAWDVFGSADGAALKSAHLLPQYVDFPVHGWVRAHVSPELRFMAAEKIISNLPIWTASAGWLACAAGAIARNPARGSRGVGLAASALWALTGAGSGRSDILVVDVLKHAFHRVRPSELGNSYAFPSGHTTAAVFCLGTLLYVILPLCAAGPDGDTDGSDLGAKESRALDAAVDALRSRALALWALGGAVTAGGRILADVHWVSDTMAGACLGVFLVSATASLCKLIRT